MDAIDKVMEDFNSGKVIPEGELPEFKPREPEHKKLMVKSVTMQKAIAKTGNPYYFFELEIIDTVDGSYTSKVRNFINFAGDKMLDPATRGYKWQEEQRASSVIYEICQSAKKLDKEGYEARKKETKQDVGRDWKGMLEGLEFTMDCFMGDKKDGSGVYLIVLSEAQKEYDGKKKQAQNTDDDGFATATTDTLPINEIDPDDLPF